MYCAWHIKSGATLKKSSEKLTRNYDVSKSKCIKPECYATYFSLTDWGWLTHLSLHTAKQLAETISTYSYLNPWEPVSAKFESQYNNTQ